MQGDLLDWLYQIIWATIQFMRFNALATPIWCWCPREFLESCWLSIHTVRQEKLIIRGWQKQGIYRMGRMYSPARSEDGQGQVAGETFLWGLTVSDPLKRVHSTPGKDLPLQLILPGNILVDSPRSTSLSFSWFRSIQVDNHHIPIFLEQDLNLNTHILLLDSLWEGFWLS